MKKYRENGNRVWVALLKTPAKTSSSSLFFTHPCHSLIPVKEWVFSPDLCERWMIWMNFMTCSTFLLLSLKNTPRRKVDRWHGTKNDSFNQTFSSEFLKLVRLGGKRQNLEIMTVKLWKLLSFLNTWCFCVACYKLQENDDVHFQLNSHCFYLVVWQTHQTNCTHVRTFKNTHKDCKSAKKYYAWCDSHADRNDNDSV